MRREVEGIHSMPYLTGIGIFGGMALFSNKVKGVLLGPLLLSLVMVGYNLHAQLMGVVVG